MEDGMKIVSDRWMLQSRQIVNSLERVARVDEICMKLTGWRMRSYPLEIYAGDELIWYSG